MKTNPASCFNKVHATVPDKSVCVKGCSVTVRFGDHAVALVAPNAEVLRDFWNSVINMYYPGNPFHPKSQDVAIFLQARITEEE